MMNDIQLVLAAVEILLCLKTKTHVQNCTDTSTGVENRVLHALVHECVNLFLLYPGVERLLIVEYKSNT